MMTTAMILTMTTKATATTNQCLVNIDLFDSGSITIRTGEVDVVYTGWDYSPTTGVRTHRETGTTFLISGVTYYLNGEVISLCP